MVLALIAVLAVLALIFGLIGLAVWAFISIGIVGIIIGGLARLILPGQQHIGVLATVLLGWIGSIVGGFIGDHIIHMNRIFTVLLEIGIAAALIALYSGSSSRYPAGRGLNKKWYARW
jgi:uncharacterized membrane protein YeaQ/YmgE (transglycosylase-associated protein family)